METQVWEGRKTNLGLEIRFERTSRREKYLEVVKLTIKEYPWKITRQTIWSNSIARAKSIHIKTIQFDGKKSDATEY